MAETDDGQLIYHATWRELRDGAIERHQALVNDSIRMKPMRAALVEAFRDYLLNCYSESIRLERGTEWAPLDGWDGARLIAGENLQLRPSEIDKMGVKELTRTLHRELHDFKLPQKAAAVCKFDLLENGLYLMWERHQDQNDE